MRLSPTFSHLGWGFLAAAIIIGCSSTQSSETPVNEPSPSEPDAKQEDQVDNSPAFDPKFKDGGAAQKDASSTKGPTEKCDDPDDPGSAENVATELPNTSDCDENYQTVSGVANGSADVDWYKLTAEDKINCVRQTHFSVNDANTEFCVYATCQNSTENGGVTGCHSGDPDDQNSLGMKGCCAKGPGEAIPDLKCKGWPEDDSATFYIRVRQVNTAACLPYSFKYRF